MKTKSLKQQMLEMSGLTEGQFYKSFPDEKSFMAKFGKQMKKAQLGEKIKKAQFGSLTPTAWDALNQGTDTLAKNAMKFYPPDNNQMLQEAGQYSMGDFYGNSPMQQMSPRTGNTQVSSTGPSALQQFTSANQKTPDYGTMLAQGVPILGKVVQGFQQLHDEKLALKEANKNYNVTKAQAQAAGSRDVDFNRMNEQLRWRPEDMPIQPGQLNSPYGTGTNVLAKYGGEIQNTYAPHTLYTNLETAQEGAFLQGLNQFAGAGGADKLGNIAMELSGGDSAGSTFGGAAADAVGMIPGIGPIAKLAAKPLFEIAGNILDRNPEKTKRANNATYGNINRMAFGEAGRGIQGQYNNYMRTGGNLRQNNMALGGELQTHWGGTADEVSYNPYLGPSIEFNGNSHEQSDGQGNKGIGMTYGKTPTEVEDNEPAQEINNELVIYGRNYIPKGYLDDPNAKGMMKNYVNNLNDKEGKINNNIKKAIEKIGEIDTRGAFGTIALNTLLKGEIEGGNMKLADIANKKKDVAALQQAILDTGNDLNIDPYHLSKGNIKTVKYGTNLLKAQRGATLPITKIPTSTDFSNASQDVKKHGEDRLNANALLDKDFQIYRDYSHDHRWTNYINYDDWKKNVYQYGIQGAWHPEFRDWYNKKYGIAPITATTQNTTQGHSLNDQKVTIPYKGNNVVKPVITGKTPTPKVKGKPTSLTPATLTGDFPGRFNEKGENMYFNPDSDIQNYPPAQFNTSSTPETTIDKTTDAPATNYPLQKINPWATALNTFVPLIRPSNVEQLDPRQLAGEMYALSNNQVEPVQAQAYHPQLGTPYDVVLPKGELYSQLRAAQRNMGYNPAAQASLAGQAYDKLDELSGKEFILNQAEKDKVYGENRNTLNDTQLKNLNIYDTQYQRQAEAKSNTKAINQMALNSISDKFLKNKLENRTLAIDENMYNYRYDARGRAWNWNPPAQFNVAGNNNSNGLIYAPDGTPLYPQWKNGVFKGYEPAQTAMVDEQNPAVEKTNKYKRTKTRNGAIIKAFKNS